MSKLKRALISVSDKRGVVELAQALNSYEVEILSTGGTAKALRKADIPVKDVSEHTDFPEMMDGRLKTIHPKIHGGLLGRRDRKEDREDMQKHGIEPIDMLVVNLYPFEATISKEGTTFNDALENIDIGGPAMLRAASKNFQDVAVVVDPNDYEGVISEMINLRGELSYNTKARLARKVFEHTARYDTVISNYLMGMSEEERAFPGILTMSFKRHSELRYGENPHQKAASYVANPSEALNLLNAKMLQGKAMSFNNYCDTHCALMLALEFQRHSCAIIKHNNPCGVAVGEGAADAYVKAVKTDPLSAFGGVLAFNASIDGDAAREITKIFVEVIVAPDFTDEALGVFSEKPDIRLLKMPDMGHPPGGWDMKRIAGGLVVQDWDRGSIDVRALKPVTKRQPSDEEIDGLDFAWRVCKHVKSNAMVYAFKDRTVGIGIGQTSRVSAARVGAINALEPLRGTVVASDGFLPFKDGIDGIKKVGVTAVIQPGGSVNDKEVIEAANEYAMAMLFSGIRHFRH
jgi:phosphoribosylaminoimidazolecarboxamide formyltransferase/IMP cyclohydrolase